MSKIRLGIIGCGLVAEESHLPATTTTDTVKLTTLVEKNTARGNELAKRFGVPNVTDDYKSIFNEVDAVVRYLLHVLTAFAKDSI